MKHGPIARLSSETPVIAVAIERSVLPKLISNLEEGPGAGGAGLRGRQPRLEHIAEHATTAALPARCAAAGAAPRWEACGGRSSR